MFQTSNFQIVIDESDAIQALLCDMKIHEIVTYNTEWAEKYNSFSQFFDLGDSLDYSTPDDKQDYIETCMSQWFMPDEYKTLDVRQYVIDKCETQEEIARVEYELDEFQKRNMDNVLRFLIYFVDHMRNNRLFWGVGRGSSVASYVLYLIGVHKINSLKYNLDIGEFLR